MKIAIPDDYQDCVRRLAAFTRLAGHEVRVFNDTVHETDALAERLADAEALVLTRERTRVDAALLERLPRLRLVSQTGKVSSHLDVAACTARGVAVAESSSNGNTTAELAWLLMMASRRELVPEVDALRAGRWQTTLGRRMQGQRLGLWSYGRIGRQVAAYARAFEMAVWVWGREASLAAARADGVEVAPSREAFFEGSDIVSLHLRLHPATRGIVTAGDLARMKPDALFVNTSRAELVAPGALLAALRAGRPGFAAIDVFESEPVLDAADPLVGMPQVLCTPHLGYVERENYERLYGGAFDNILAFAAGQPTGLVNPEVWRGAA